MTQPRFKLRTVLIFVAIIAICFAAYPRLRWHLQWGDARVEVENWAKSLKRGPEGVEEYTHFDVSFDPALANPLSGISYSVLTAEPEMVRLPDGNIDWNIRAGTVPDPTRFFVIPPGKWVDDVDGVIEAWDRFQSDGYRY